MRNAEASPYGVPSKKSSSIYGVPSPVFRYVATCRTKGRGEGRTRGRTPLLQLPLLLLVHAAAHRLRGRGGRVTVHCPAALLSWHHMRPHETRPAAGSPRPAACSYAACCPAYCLLLDSLLPAAPPIACCSRLGGEGCLGAPEPRASWLACAAQRCRATPFAPVDTRPR